MELVSPFIVRTDDCKYLFHIPPLDIYKLFDTLEEAKAFREDMADYFRRRLL